VTVATNGRANAVLIAALCPPPLVAVRIAPPPATLVSGKVNDVNVPDVTITLYAPTVAFAVKVFDVAWPFAPVTSVSIVDAGVVANVALAPEAGAVKVTETPLTGLLLASVTVATNGLANAVLTVAVCPPPLVALRCAAAPAVLVKAKLAGVSPEIVAVTAYDPIVKLAVHVTEILPLTSVVPVIPESAQLAPVVGAANVTVSPLSGAPFEVTFATSGAAKAVLIAVLWPAPLAAVITMVGGAPAMLVKAKLAGVVAPEVVAVTEYDPVVELAVNAEDVATPFGPVVSVSVSVPLPKSPLAPADGARKVTEIPLAGTPLEVTVAESVPNEAPTTAVAVYPPTAVITMVGGGAAVFVKAKLAGAVAPDVVAVTEYDPVAESAVKTEDVTTPFEPVTSVSVTVPLLANVPLVPEAGAVKVTETPLAGVPLEVTVAESVPNEFRTTALAVYPVTGVIRIVGGGTAVLVKAKLADVVAPEVEAVTL
jgi:hypothetical protein